MEFGERLRELRLQQGLSQRKLAKEVGINFTYLSKIETGKMSPPAQDTIQRLATALDADPDELLVLAGRVPNDVKDVVTKSSELPTFLREIQDLDEGEIEELKRKAQEIKRKRQEKHDAGSTEEDTQ